MFISSGYFLCSRAVLKTIIESFNHWQIFNILCIIYMLHTQCSVSIQNSFKLFSCFTSTLSPWFHIHKCAFEPPRKDLIIWHWKTHFHSHLYVFLYARIFFLNHYVTVRDSLIFAWTNRECWDEVLLSVIRSQCAIDLSNQFS